MDNVNFDSLMTKYKDGLEKALNYLKTEFVNIRAGRANPHVLDKILVDYYGSKTPINQMGNVSVSEGRVLVISIWDQSAMKSVVKAIQESDIGINPTDDGKVIRLAFPALTEERRVEIGKQIKQIAETTKINMRNCRRDIIDAVKEMKKNTSLSEDQQSLYEKDIQKQLDNYTANVDLLVANKEKEIMEI
jgi:ribosome recycling factor